MPPLGYIVIRIQLKNDCSTVSLPAHFPSSLYIPYMTLLSLCIMAYPTLICRSVFTLLVMVQLRNTLDSRLVMNMLECTEPPSCVSLLHQGQ